MWQAYKYLVDKYSFFAVLRAIATLAQWSCGQCSRNAHWCSQVQFHAKTLFFYSELVLILVLRVFYRNRTESEYIRNCIFIAGIFVDMALCRTSWFMSLERCNKLPFNNISLVPVTRTLSCCCRRFSASAKLTLPLAANNHLSAAKNLFRPFSAIIRCERLLEKCTHNHVVSWSRTVQSSGYLHPKSNWVSKSRLLSSFHHSSDLSLLRTFNKFSAASKNVHDSQSVGLNQSANAKQYQKWSISGVVRQLVCHRI